MKHGIILSAGMPHQIVAQAQAAEAAGWDGVFTSDTISLGADDIFDPWTLLGAIAAVTERVTLGAITFALARRKPWEVARQALTLDHLSRGRLVLPVGLGDARDAAFSRVNTDAPDLATRGNRLDECLAFLEEAWSTDLFTFDRENYYAEDFLFRPPPVQRPRIPVWCAGQWPSELSMNRAVRWDGVVPSLTGGHRLSDGHLRALKSWVDTHRPAHTPFEIVVEADSEPDTEEIQQLAAIGTTWLIERRPELRTPDALLERIHHGPIPAS